MSITFNQYLEHLQTNKRELIYKIEILRDLDESVYDTFEGFVLNNSGNLSISLNSGVRRTCDFSISNIGKRYNDFVNGLTIGSKFKLWLGYKINGENYYISQGVFLFDDPSLISNLSDRQVSLSGTDKFAMLNGQAGGIFDGTYKVPSSSNVANVIRTLLALDICNDSIEPLIDPSLETLVTPYTITKESGEYVSDLIYEMLFAIGAICYYNTDGRLVVKPYQQDNLKGSIYDFTYTDYNYKGSNKRKLNSEIYNSCLVVADNVSSTSVPIVYEAINNREDDSNSVINLGRKKVKKITEYTNAINSLNLAIIRAEYELALVSRLQSSVDITCSPIYHLDVDEIITLSDEYINSDRERFLINNINFSIGTSGNGTLNVTKAID